MQQAEKYPFMKRMAAAGVPLRLRLELTRRCNLRCIHCKVHCDNQSGGELAAAEIGGLLDQARELGTMEVSITGGEVFARPDITNVLNTIFKRDFQLHIQTNATAITSDHIALLSQHIKKILRVSVSVYAHDPAVHDQITGVPGSHARTLENLFAMRDAGIPIYCFTLLMKENAAQARNTKLFYEKHGLPYQFNTFIIPRDDGCAAPLAQRIPAQELPDLPVNWYGYLNPEGAEDPERFHAGATLDAWCPAGRFAVVTAAGDVIPCSLLRESAGNIRKQSFRDIWTRSPVLQRVRDLRLGELECFSCNLFPVCKPCVGLANMENGDLRKRPTEMCRLSHALLGKEHTDGPHGRS
jgi:radical SAM protein with 4Fe4S-binding SPASM domain